MFRRGTSNFLEELGLREVVAGILSKATESISKEGVRSAVGTVSDGSATRIIAVLAKAAPDLVAGAAGILVLPLLKALLGASDRVSENLRTLLDEPQETGMRMAEEAVSVLAEGAVDDESRRFLEKRLHEAITKLETAYTHARRSRIKDSELAYLRLVVGLCELNVGGGEALARKHLGATMRYLKGVQKQLRAKSHESSRRSPEVEVQVAALPSVFTSKGPPVFTSMPPLMWHT